MYELWISGGEEAWVLYAGRVVGAPPPVTLGLLELALLLLPPASRGFFFSQRKSMYVKQGGLVKYYYRKRN